MWITTCCLQAPRSAIPEQDWLTVAVRYLYIFCLQFFFSIDIQQRLEFAAYVLPIVIAAYVFSI